MGDTDRLTEFPALEERLAHLKLQIFNATRQGDAQVDADGRPDPGIQLWLVGVREEVRELTFALAMLYRQNNRIEIPGRVVVVGGIVLALIVLLQVAILIWLGQ